MNEIQDLENPENDFDSAINANMEWLDRPLTDKQLKRNPWARSRFAVKFSDRLKDLGITEDDYDFYEKTFVQQHTRYWKLLCSRGSHWFQVSVANKGKCVPIPLKKYDVLSHLEGKYWIAKKMAGKSDFFVVDLDNKGSVQPLQKRYKEIVKAFGTPIVFQSSDSGGLHLYYFLDHFEWRYVIGGCLGEFYNYGLIPHPKSGSFEYFPYGIDHLRLPLGKGSRLLDPKILKPLDLNLKQSLIYIRSNKYHSIVDLRKYKDRSKSNSMFTDQNYTENKPTHLYPSNQNDDESLYNTPIKEEGTRNQIQMNLIQDCILRRGYNEKQTYWKILDWYEKPNLKHESSDWDIQPEMVKKELKAAINNFIGKLHHKNHFKGIQENINLTLDDVRFILNITEPLKVNGKYRRGAYYMQKFLLDLLLFYKRKHTSLLFLPFKTVARLNGSSKKTASDNIKFCEKYGILKLEGKADIEQHKSRRYYLNYKFQPGKTVENFELGVFLIFDISQLFREYSRGVYERILKIANLL